MQKIKSFIITIIFLFGIFYSINFSFAAILGHAQCTDGTTRCGYIANVPLFDSCSMSGGDIYASYRILEGTDGTTGCGYIDEDVPLSDSDSCSMSGGDIYVYDSYRILGGQECYTIGGQDFGGYYMIGTKEPKSNTQIYPFSDLNMTAPWGWTYYKKSDMSRYFGGSSIPTGVFQGDGPYYNLKFFDPVGVSVSMLRFPDDSFILQIGSNYVWSTGCPALFTDVKKDGCPASILMGPTNFNASIGDRIMFKVTNILRPNNGSGTWGDGEVRVTFDNLTVCYTQAYFDYFCGSPGCSGKPNYIPTAPGVCSPEPKPKAKLKAYWKENNSQSIEKTITKGQSIQIPFIVENIGDIGSVIDNIQCILSNTSLGSISNCPSSLNK